MKTVLSRRDVRTEVTPDDEERIHRLLVHLGPHATLEARRVDSPLPGPLVWARIVAQVCVMGSARGMETLERDPRRRSMFVRDTSLRELTRLAYRRNRIAAVLRHHQATRFPVRAADRLRRIIDTPASVERDRCVLLRGLRPADDHESIRRTLLDRCPVFKMKSASDFMIGTGMSHDVIALDVRVVGVLRRYFGYNLAVGHVQTRPDIYRSLESALRAVCARAGQPLALLDRVLFQFSGMSVLEYVARFG